MANVPQRSEVMQPRIVIKSPKPLSKNAKVAMACALKRSAGTEVTTCDLLLGLLQSYEGLACQVLMNFDVTLEKAWEKVNAMTKDESK